jgi:pimeloyl-ACP methyl ester carboxylesterase
VTVLSRGRSSDNSGVRIESREWVAPTTEPGVPIVFVPGGTGNALAGEDLGHDAATGAIGDRPRSLLSISRRGTGESDAPPVGYTPSHFASDVHAAAMDAGYPRFVLFGHSMGVPIALEYALTHPDQVAALALGDTPAAYLDFKAAGTFAPLLKRRFEFSSWDDVYDDLVLRFEDRTQAPARERFDRNRHRFWTERGGMIRTLLDRDSIVRTVEESVTCATEYWSRLRELTCTILLLRGTVGWSPLTDEDVRRYRMALPGVAVRELPSGHDLGLSTDRRPLYEALGKLVRPIDGATPR